jgi:hypothetical protein
MTYEVDAAALVIEALDSMLIRLVRRVPGTAFAISGSRI